jgi:HEXXH motif-containing protein
MKVHSITTHRLPEEAFMALASGDGDPAVVRHLRGVQQSKHLMLLRVIAGEAESIDPAFPGVAAFWAGYRLLAEVQRSDPGAFAWLFGLPHIGGWAHDCLARTGQGLPLDFGYLAAAAAAAGIRAGVRFELDVPVSDGRVMLPGLGHFQDIDQDPWVRLRSDGECLSVGAATVAPCAALMPDDGSGEPVPLWRGTYQARAVAQGRTWTILLETSDRYLDRFALPMCTALTAEEVTSWRGRIQSAWEVLIRHHGWAAESIAEGVSVIVPLTARGDTDLDSATTPAAFGAIATSWPPDPVIMAETLVHEFQHLKLCGLLDMVPLVEPSAERVYAPWRPDPRPAGGLLQGVYAHLGVARYWNAQRHAETEPDDMLRAQVMFERWRSTIEPASATLLRTGCLTPDGARFVAMVRDEGRRLSSEAVPADAMEIAREVALDHWLTWQLRHSAVDRARVAELADAYQRGEPLSGRELPGVRIEEETRKISSAVRSQLLNMRYLEPRRYREQSAAGIPELSEADVLLVSGQAGAAVQAYREEILSAPEPLPDPWAGLALAVHLLEQTPLLAAFTTRLPLMFDVHAYLCGEGLRSDPLDLAAWFA